MEHVTALPRVARDVGFDAAMDARAGTTPLGLRDVREARRGRRVLRVAGALAGVPLGLLPHVPWSPVALAAGVVAVASGAALAATLGLRERTLAGWGYLPGVLSAASGLAFAVGGGWRGASGVALLGLAAGLVGAWIAKDAAPSRDDVAALRRREVTAGSSRAARRSAA